jgi:protein gp37
MEPLLGPVDLRANLPGERMLRWYRPMISMIDWVIVGGESGPGARPMHPEWARSLRDQCTAAGVPFLFKQWGEWAPRHDLQCNEPGIKGRVWHNFDPDTSVCNVGKKAAGRLLGGREWNEVPA